MDERDDVEAVAEAPLPPFNALTAVLDVLRQPASAMRAIASHRAWLPGLAVYVVAAIAAGLAGTVNTAQQLAEARKSLSDIGMCGMLPLLDTMASPTLAVISWLVLAPLSMVITAGLYWLLGRAFGGRGAYRAVAAIVGYANAPNLPWAVVLAGLNLGGPAFGALTSLLALVVLAWNLVLIVFGLRASLRLDTGRAIAVPLIVFVAIVAIGCCALLVFTAALGSGGGVTPGRC